ncbi:hypothetical protein [Bifidobacterium cuniculi]|uniref:XRE family transcriptional regulator n=1 Tax=Bifidobacterium cuniculi TaxID=1688 RepID=A0A087ATI5_9BIFI|nr:hypothetical protein [Bifidobacterium cuniculi]KFI62085.1 hypothetical protein BCUN_1401 [Bifidobacterium cuniculi]
MIAATLDLSAYDRVTAYGDRPLAPASGLEYFPRPQDVAGSVAAAMGRLGMDADQVALAAGVDVYWVRSLMEQELSDLRDARRVFAVLGIRTVTYPREMVAYSL